MRNWPQEKISWELEHIFKNPVRIRMLEENEGRQSGLNQIGEVSGANSQRFNFKSF